MGTLKQKIQAALDTKEAIKNAIIAKGQPITDDTKYADYPTAIEAIESGVNTDDGNITSGSVLDGKIGYAKGKKIVGKIPSRSYDSVYVDKASVVIPSGYYGMQITKGVGYATQATPTLSQNGNVVTATVNQAAGYVEAGEKTASLTLSDAGAITGTLGSPTGISGSNGVTGSGTVNVTVTQRAGYTAGQTNGNVSVTVPSGKMYAGRTIVPTTYAQTAIAAGGLANGAITVNGDTNLIPGNIRSGISIFGVLGSFVGSSDGIIMFTQPSGSKTMSIPWASSNYPNRVIGFWIDTCTLNGNPYPYFIYAFARTGSILLAEYDTRDNILHEEIGFTESMGQGYYDLRNTASNTGWCNGRWLIAIS